MCVVSLRSMQVSCWGTYQPLSLSASPQSTGHLNATGYFTTVCLRFLSHWCWQGKRVSWWPDLMAMCNACFQSWLHMSLISRSNVWWCVAKKVGVLSARLHVKNKAHIHDAHLVPTPSHWNISNAIRTAISMIVRLLTLACVLPTNPSGQNSLTVIYSLRSRLISCTSCTRAFSRTMSSAGLLQSWALSNWTHGSRKWLLTMVSNTLKKGSHITSSGRGVIIRNWRGCSWRWLQEWWKVVWSLQCMGYWTLFTMLNINLMWIWHWRRWRLPSSASIKTKRSSLIWEYAVTSTYPR